MCVRMRNPAGVRVCRPREEREGPAPALAPSGGARAAPARSRCSARRPPWTASRARPAEVPVLGVGVLPQGLATTSEMWVSLKITFGVQGGAVRCFRRQPDRETAAKVGRGRGISRSGTWGRRQTKPTGAPAPDRYGSLHPPGHAGRVGDSARQGIQTLKHSWGKLLRKWKAG